MDRLGSGSERMPSTLLVLWGAAEAYQAGSFGQVPVALLKFKVWLNFCLCDRVRWGRGEKLRVQKKEIVRNIPALDC